LILLVTQISEREVIKMLGLYVRLSTLAWRVREALRERAGQGTLEYGLLLGLVVVGTIVILAAIGGKLTNLFTRIRDALP
jgi:Flp pilus assembly pilin Flp